MHFTIITAFPEFFGDFLSTSIIGRAVKAGLIRVDVVDLRSFGRGGYRQVDDYAFGAGGMVLMAQPLFEALETARGRHEGPEKSFVVCPTPQGALLTQDIVETLACQAHVVLVCGHYEGLDERFIERSVDLEVTIGDCVLTGGEIPAMAIIDAVARLRPGVVGRSEAVEDDSFYRGMLDHPHYTRPASWDGREVPEALLSGNAASISEWRRTQAAARTLARRPDLLSRNSLRGYIRGGIYLSFEFENVADIGPDFLKEVGLLSESYGVARVFLIVSDPGDRPSVRRSLEEMNREMNRETSPEGRFRLMPSLAHAIRRVADRRVAEKEGTPLTVKVCDAVQSGARHWLELKRLFLEKGDPVLFYLPSMAEDRNSDTQAKTVKQANECGFLMLPLQEGLSVCGKTAVLCDRFLGSRQLSGDDKLSCM
ncbi:MAG: tRNA (guanosine(37)-N1)-methyltransferase TrmD [Synergistaceae bacterium]|jgi:tRNA (guanine37-N1)-methyltransferase|nr:tRNA (guanosine(37)-N1)-methyltransferase TrmD [Synergistaceae bacterium]